MPKASVKRLIDNKKDKLIEFVLDIEKYPEFVPWCLEGKINEKKENENTIEMKGDLKVGKKFLNETYSSLILCNKLEDRILVTNIDGPLKHLKNIWQFKEINNSTQLDFEIDFELKNNLLNTIMKKSFNFGLNKIADAFEKRAMEIYKQ